MQDGEQDNFSYQTYHVIIEVIVRKDQRQHVQNNDNEDHCLID